MSEDGKNEPPDRRRGEEKADSANAETLKVRQEVLASSGRVDPPARTFGPRDWFFAAALVAAVFAAYQPAWQGGFVWDDDAHVTRPALRSWHGLYRIWFDLGATQQYYPLLHSAFWLQYKLWGATTLGYHLVNIFLHAAAALMVAMILRRLAIPGAYLAAAIFALHPLQVESVAWITELKNTLSGVFYLGAMLSYLRFDHTRGRSWYALDTAVVPLGSAQQDGDRDAPCALWVIIWWKRGRLSWKTDVLPLLPFFLSGRGGGPAHSLGRAETDRRRGRCVYADVGPARADRRPSNLVLPGQTLLAGRPDFHLPALASQSVRRGSSGYLRWRRRRCCWPCGRSVAAAAAFWRRRCFSSERCSPRSVFSTCIRSSILSWPTIFSTWRAWE